MMLAATLKAVVELDLTKADQGLAKLDTQLTKAAATAQRSANAMDKAFASIKVPNKVTGIEGMGSAIDSLGAKLNALSSKPHSVQVTARVQAAQAELSRLNVELQRLKGQPATVQVKADTRQVREQIAAVRREVQQLQQSTASAGGTGGGGGLGGLFSGLGGGVAVLGAATLAVGALGKAVGAVVGPGASFEAEMSAVQATTHASASEMAALSAEAMRLGAATDVGAVGASDAAAAIFELSKAGASTQQILAGAATAALQMSAAAGPEFGVANSAALAANAMNTFSRENLTATQVANTFVGAANASSAGLNDLKLGFGAVSSVANTVGISMHDTAEALALFANKGLMASDSGTSFKTMLLNLQPQTDAQKELFNELGITTADMGNKFFDAQGHAQNLAGIAEVLKTSFSGMTDQARLAAMEVAFGSDAVRAAAILYGEGATGVDKLSEAMAKQGNAAEAAATMSNNAKGKWDALKGTFETLAISAGTKVTPALGQMAEALNKLAASDGAQKAAADLGTAFAGLVTNITAGVDTIANAGQRVEQFNAILVVSANNLAQSLGLASAAETEAANQAAIASAMHQEVMIGGYNAVLSATDAYAQEVHNHYVASAADSLTIWNASGDDLVGSANITGETMLHVGQATGASYSLALSNSLRAGAPALNDYWADLENLFDQQAFMASAGANNAKAYTHALSRELHMQMGDLPGIYRDPVLDKWINSNMDQLVKEDVRGKRMAGGAGNAAIQAEATWAAVGRTAQGAANLPGYSGGVKVPAGTKAKGTKATGTTAKAPDPKSAIKEATDQTQNISKAITDGIAALNQLSQFTMPTGLTAGLDAFAVATNQVMQRLQQVALQYSTKGLEATTALAEASGKVFASLSAGVDFFSKLTEATQKGVTFSGQTLAAATVLAGSVIAVTSTFGSLVPPWKDEQTAHVSSFAEASGKVLGGLSAGVDLYSKIADAMKAGVTFSGSAQAQTEQLARLVVQTVSLFGSLVPPWKTEQTKQVGEYAEASGKVLSSLSTAVDFASKIAEATKAGVGFGQDLVSAATQLSAASSTIVQQFASVVPAWDDLANEKVSAYAETAGKVLGLIGTATDALSKLRDSELGLAQIASLVPVAQGVGEAINGISVTFAASMPVWDELATKHVGEYSDAAGKIAGTIGATTDTLSKLQDSGLGLAQVQSLIPAAQGIGEATNLIAASFKAGMPAWDELASVTVGTFAENAAKVVSAINGTVDLFQNLQDVNNLLVPWAAMDTVMQLLLDTTEHFQNQTAEWNAVGVAASADLATAASTIVSGISGALDLLTKLQALEDTSVPDAALQAVITGLTIAVQRFQAATVGWEPKGLAAAAELATSVGTVVGAMGAGVDVLTKLSTFSAPSTAQIDSFFASLSVFVAAFAIKAQAWEPEGMAAAAGVAESVGHVVGGIGAAIDPLVKLGTFVAPSQEGIDSFFAALTALILAFQAHEAAWAAQMTPATVQLATDVGAVSSAIGSAVDMLTKLSGAELNPDAMVAVLAGLSTVLASLPTTIAQGVAENIQAALGILATVGDQLMQGLAGGIDQGTHWVEEAARRAVQAAIEAGKNEGEIASPSKRTRAEWGLPLMAGAAGGVAAGIPLLTGAVRKGFAAAFAVPLPAASFSGAALSGPPLPPATPGPSGSYSKGGSGGGQTTIIKDSTIVNGAVHATVPTANREFLIGVARREAIKNPGKVRS